MPDDLTLADKLLLTLIIVMCSWILIKDLFFSKGK